jgi:hypothetical protein
MLDSTGLVIILRRKLFSFCKQQTDGLPNTSNPLGCPDIRPTDNNEQLVEWLLATRSRLLALQHESHGHMLHLIPGPCSLHPSSVTHPDTTQWQFACIYSALS